MSSYTFKAELFGLDVEVSGEFEAGESQTMTDPGLEPCFVIECISHKDEAFEVDALPDKELNMIEKVAFEKAADEHGEY